MFSEFILGYISSSHINS